MAESTASTETAAPETASPAPSAPELAPESSGAEGQVTAPETVAAPEAPAPKTYSDWKEAVADADPDELLDLVVDRADREKLLRQRKLGGLIGDVADRRAKALYPTLKEQEAEQNLLREKDEALEKGDDFRVGEIERELKQLRTKKAAEQAASGSMLSTVQSAVAPAMTAEFGPEVVDSLAGRTYDGDVGTALIQYFRDIVKAAAERERSTGVAAAETKLFAKWERERLPALKKAWLAEQNGAEPSPEVSSGTPTGAKRAFTLAEIQRMSPAEFEEHEAAILAAVPSVPANQTRR